MTRTPPPAIRRSLRTALLLLGVVGATAAGLELLVDLDYGAGSPVKEVLLNCFYPVAAITYLACGLVAWLRRPASSFGPVLTFGSFSFLAAGLGNFDVPILTPFGTMVAVVPLAVVVHLMHAFPYGRVQGGLSRWTVVAGYLTATLGQAPSYLFAGGSGHGADLSVKDDPELGNALTDVQNGFAIAILALTLLVLLSRVPAMSARQRAALAPLTIVGAASVLAVPVGSGIILLFGGDPYPSDAACIGCPSLDNSLVGGSIVLLVPFAFVAAVWLGAFARVGELEELATWLGAGRDPGLTVSGAVAQTLGDDSAIVAFPVGQGDGYVDEAGRPVDLPRAGSARATSSVRIDGREVGAIVYDRTVNPDAEFVAAAGRIAALAIDRERLVAELRAGREALRASTARVVTAADQERRRIARDLHDGTQADLVLLTLQANNVANLPDLPPSAREAIKALGTSLTAAATDLRRFVNGVMPAALIEGGLTAGLRDFADRIPIATDLDLRLPNHRLPSTLESTAYLVVAEAVTNALKYACCSTLSIRVEQQGERLTIDVRDDGVGGATVGAGSGLTGLADRLGALDGTLAVTSPEGGGTAVHAELPFPCGGAGTSIDM